MKRLDVLNSILQHIDKAIEELKNVRPLMEKHFTWMHGYTRASQLVSDLLTKLYEVKGNFLEMKNIYDMLEREVEE
ncbi:MAG: hypothetical protein DRJ60_03200 [Thermoprotei archaeon]|nr:MAG: hypothetical protein DRJ60_03200 [Thermoprotei archaeon]